METKAFYSYLDDFDELTIIIPMRWYRDNNSYALVGNDETVDLVIEDKTNLGTEVKLICSFEAYIRPEMLYFVIDEDGVRSELHTGKIVRTELFDNIYHYKKNDLGFTYSPESTKFKLWTPTAKYVRLELIDPQGVLHEYEVPYKNQGVWRLVVEGDLDGWKYRYRVYVNGKERELTDPYAIASAANAEFSYVINPARLVPMSHRTTFSGDPLEAVIYEASIRDFTIDPEMGFQNKGRYLGLIESGIKTPEGRPAGLDHLKELGITHVQLMPFFDFAGVDERFPEGDYNWGYNPRQYFVPEGWFSTNPEDPYARLNELRTMIDGLHRENINVIMDVVYNHVWDAEEFSMEKLVPGYAYHVDKQGIYTGVSGCGNDLATHRKMVRKLIIDSALYWVNEFHVDGFRFDLMGMIDTETMNELRQELHELDPHVIVYGEGWRMHSGNMADGLAHMRNKNVIYTIGFFNDTFRETIKGKTFDVMAEGYATGSLKDIETVREVLLGSADNRYLFKYTSQSVNYVECHDNHTFFDKAMMISGNPALVRKQQKLATAMTILAQGVPFLHSGQEFCRTKKDVENSYDAGDDINLLDWSRLDEFADDVAFLRDLIAFRKEHREAFRLRAASDLAQCADTIPLASGSILYRLNNGADLLILFKPLQVSETVVIDPAYRIRLASGSAYRKSSPDAYEFHDIGTYVFEKER